MRKEFIISFLILLPLFAITFQNCSKTEFSTQEEPSSSNSRTGENGIAPSPDINNSADCSEGEKLALWLDNNHDGNKDKLLGYITAYNGSESAALNYNYYSASAHPKIGPKPSAFASHIFFYKGPEGLSFNFFHNIDKAGSQNNKVYWDISVKNNNFSDVLLLSDDPGEIITDSRSANATYYKAYVEYWKNTDGGIIGPLTSKNFEIKVNVAQGNGDLTNSAFYSANGDIYSLSNGATISSFIITYDSFNECKND